MSFLSKVDLESIFYTEGSFYQLELNGESYTCRSLAKITRNNVKTIIVDALFVLVNPGSCQPIEKDYIYPAYDNLKEIPFVRAASDQTQHQIMRLMERMGWNLTYIINLSDLQAGNIDDFRRKLKIFEANTNDIHSIFSDNRRKAIKILISENTHIIAGWGTKTFLRKKAYHALEVLSDLGEVRGLPHTIEPFYRHPFPMIKDKCMKWINDMEVELQQKV